MQATGELAADDDGGGGSREGDHRRAAEDVGLPRQRHPWMEPPNYGPNDELFSIEVNHGGFFCGLGKNRKYLDTKVDCFDEFNRESFCCAFLDYILKELGYSTANRKIRVYWCKPGRTIGDGLVAINWEKDADMMKKCALQVKKLIVYVDHVNLLEKQRWDDVSEKQTQLPTVMSPSNQAEKHKAEGDDVVSIDETKKKATKGKSVVSAEDVLADDIQGQYLVESSDDEKGSVISCYSSDSSDLDSDFEDSDYEFEEDDEQFKKHVDEGVKDDLIEKTKSKIQREPEKDIGEVDELELPEEHKSEITYKWKMFNKLTDMQNPTFKTGMVFSSVEEVRAAISMYIVETKYIVELNLRSCSCRRWQLTGIPCTHACACLRHEGARPEQMVSNCYSIHTYMQAYGSRIRPLRDQSEWAKTNGPEVKPPLYEKKIGRPKKSRRKNPEEIEGGTRLSRAGVVIHCGHCKEAGHNRTGCPRLKAIADAEAAELARAQAAENVTEEHVGSDEPVPEPRPKRRKRRTIHEQVNIPNSSRGPRRVDEFGDVDIPEILEHVGHVALDPQLDPSELDDSMINSLNREVPTVIFTDDESFPEESAFVASCRDKIPTARARVTTVTSAGRAILRGGRGRARGRGRGVSVDTAAARGRGRGAGRSTNAAGRARNASTRLGTTDIRTREERPTCTIVEEPLTNIPPRGRGRAQWLLWGEGQGGPEEEQAAVDVDASQAPPVDQSQA